MASRNNRKPDIRPKGVRIAHPVVQTRDPAIENIQDVLRDNLDVTTGHVSGPLALLV
ncbi:MAG: hypothetical protein AAGD23_02090 [Pseudomonadota bacterium]